MKHLRTRLAGAQFVILGGRSDAVLAEAITPAAPGAVLDLTGRTSLPQMVEVLRRCHAVVTNDTGPMHVAAAVGTPVVVPFGSTSPELTGPGLPGDARHRLIKSDAPCSPCFLRECPIDFRCMNGLSVSALVEATLSALAGRVKNSL